jgi:alpha-1,6-mannosyltransferase
MVGVASGGIAELVDREVGELAPRATAEAMADAVLALFDRDLAEVGRSARARAVARYDWSATFEGLSRLYAELTGGPVAAADTLPFPIEAAPFQ